MSAGKEVENATFQQNKGGFAGGGKVGDLRISGGGKVYADGRVDMNFGDQGHLTFQKQGEGFSGGGKLGDQGISGGGKEGPDGRVHMHLKPQGQKK